MSESAIVKYRTRVVDAIRERFTDLQHVDWYDGLFDEDDVKNWGEATPCCYVGVLNAPTERHGTGELNGDLAIVAVVLTTDEFEPRSHDAQNWRFLEGIADFVKDNQFGDPNAGIPSRIGFKRLRHPQLRREGVGLGVVEWQTGLTFGTNTAIEGDRLRGDDDEFVRMPPHLSADMALFLGDGSDQAPARPDPRITTERFDISFDETPP